jgi:PAS domain S-box-containing protein
MVDYQLRQREFLLRISRAMSSRLDLPSLLALIIQSAVDMLLGELGFIALRRPSGEFDIRASVGIPPKLIPIFAPFLTDIPHVEGNDYLPLWQVPDLRFKLDVVAATSGVNLRQVVALPLVTEDRLLGVIYIFRSTGVDFSNNDRQVLASFADQAAIAVRNAHLYEQVSAERLLLNAVIENSPAGLMILDTQCHVVKINRALGRMTGLEPDQVVGRPCSEVLHLHAHEGAGDVDICGQDCPLQQLAPGEKKRVEANLHAAGQPNLTVQVVYTPLYDQEGNIINIVANVDDITRFREAEQLKSTFISVVSHELKTPVALIKGYADTLRREDAKWDAQTVRESLGIIVEESDHLSQLIDNLLEASRIQAGGLSLRPSHFLLPPLVEKLTTGFGLQTPQHKFQVDFHPDFPPVYGDEQRIREALSNLIGNAVKYSPQGGTIFIGGRADGQWLTVYVADQGVGIAPEEHENIFERFYRVENHLTRSTQGTGLGLYLARAIVEAHGGRIWVESMPGKGSIFIFTLPQR